MDWFVALIALVGLVLNIKGKFYCFVLWSFSNTWWLIHNLNGAEYAQAALFGAFLVFSIYGLFAWQVNDGKNKQTEILLYKAHYLCGSILSAAEELKHRPGRIRISEIMEDARDIFVHLEPTYKPGNHKENIDVNKKDSINNHHQRGDRQVQRSTGQIRQV